jgi:hypothetical protein
METLSEKRKNARWSSVQDERHKGIFMVIRFGSRTRHQVCHIENRASCTGYPDDQANYLMMTVQLSTRVLWTRQSVSNIKIIRKLEIEDSMKQINESPYLETGSTEVSD